MSRRPDDTSSILQWSSPVTWPELQYELPSSMIVAEQVIFTSWWSAK